MTSSQTLNRHSNKKRREGGVQSAQDTPEPAKTAAIVDCEPANSATEFLACLEIHAPRLDPAGVTGRVRGHPQSAYWPPSSHQELAALSAGV